MIAYNTFKLLELDWDSISRCLADYSDNEEYIASIVSPNDQKSESWHDNLYNIEQEHSKHGYTEHNTKIWKSTNKKDYLAFDWQQQLLSQLPLDCGIVTLTRQDPGQILPWHYDRHFMLKQLYPNDNRMIVRFLVFMQDWKIGHVLQIHNKIVYNWKKGQAIIWHPNTYHVSANIGLEKKWTCNVTGFLNDNSLTELFKEMEIKQDSNDS
jgi:WD40 repeat protein